jgi:hypothetical protein
MSIFEFTGGCENFSDDHDCCVPAGGEEGDVLTIGADENPEWAELPIRAGSQTIVDGSDSVAVVFSSAHPNGANYAVSGSLVNDTTTDPTLSYTIADKTSTGFTVLLSAAAPSADYSFDYAAIGNQ